MKTLTIIFLVVTGLNICQAQIKLDTNRVRSVSQPVTIHLHPAVSGHKPLIIARGKEVVNIKAVDPNSIKSIDVIGPNDSRRRVYGPKGQYGVIILELKGDSTTRN